MPAQGWGSRRLRAFRLEGPLMVLCVHSPCQPLHGCLVNRCPTPTTQPSASDGTSRMAFSLLSAGLPLCSSGSKELIARPSVVQLTFRMTVFSLEGTSEASPLPTSAQPSPEHDGRECFPSALNSSHSRSSPLPCHCRLASVAAQRAACLGRTGQGP